jgi:hypothetical protein
MSTNGTMGDTGSVNSKADKRRSGFFGFGKKDKDKKEDKFTVVEEEVSGDGHRRSFQPWGCSSRRYGAKENAGILCL